MGMANAILFDRFKYRRYVEPIIEEVYHDRILPMIGQDHELLGRWEAFWKRAGGRDVFRVARAEYERVLPDGLLDSKTADDMAGQMIDEERAANRW